MYHIKPAAKSTSDKVDSAHIRVEEIIINHREIVKLDHHRMAERNGAETPPAIVSIFTDDSKIVSELVSKNQRIGIDMPFKILAYTEPESHEASFAYTSAEFIQRRHGLEAAELSAYKKVIDAEVAQLPTAFVSETDCSNVYQDTGIISITSDYSFQETLENITAFVRDNQTNRWFSQIDLQKDAMNFDIAIRPTMLCLFGVPEVGAEAMYNAPKIGLDAFCQKVLTYQNADGQVLVVFNDATAFGELYYGTSNSGQLKVKTQMTLGLTKALTKPSI